MRMKNTIIAINTPITALNMVILTEHPAPKNRSNSEQDTSFL
jgi:hypothetical protein